MHGSDHLNYFSTKSDFFELLDLHPNQTNDRSKKKSNLNRTSWVGPSGLDYFFKTNKNYLNLMCIRKSNQLLIIRDNVCMPQIYAHNKGNSSFGPWWRQWCPSTRLIIAIIKKIIKDYVNLHIYWKLEWEKYHNFF